MYIRSHSGNHSWLQLITDNSNAILTLHENILLFGHDIHSKSNDTFNWIILQQSSLFINVTLTRIILQQSSLFINVTLARLYHSCICPKLCLKASVVVQRHSAKCNVTWPIGVFTGSWQKYRLCYGRWTLGDTTHNAYTHTHVLVRCPYAHLCKYIHCQDHLVLTLIICLLGRLLQFRFEFLFSFFFPFIFPWHIWFLLCLRFLHAYVYAGVGL